MSLRDLKAQLARLKRRAERANAPAFDEYSAAARRETARRLRGVYGRLARLPSLDGSPAPPPERNRELLTNDTPERAEADLRTVEAWERAHGKVDIGGAADEARARLLMWRK